MHKASVAESILSMSASQELAASIVGDLVEDSVRRGNLWFWTSLIRIAMSLSWQAFAGAPFRLIFWAIGAAAIWIFYDLLLKVPVVVVDVLLLSLASNIASDVAPDPRVPDIIRVALLTANVLGFVANLIAAYLFGRWLTEKAPQRELPVYIVTWSMYQVPWIVIALQNGPGLHPNLLQTMILGPILGIVFALPTFAGVRNQRLRNPQWPAPSESTRTG